MPHDFLEIEEDRQRAEAERRKRDAVPCEEPGMKQMTNVFQRVVTLAKLRMNIEKGSK